MLGYRGPAWVRDYSSECIGKLYEYDIRLCDSQECIYTILRYIHIREDRSIVMYFLSFEQSELDGKLALIGCIFVHVHGAHVVC